MTVVGRVAVVDARRVVVVGRVVGDAWLDADTDDLREAVAALDGGDDEEVAALTVGAFMVGRTAVLGLAAAVTAVVAAVGSEP